MNRRDFFKATPAVLISPLVPKPEPIKPLIGTIGVFTGKEYITIGKQTNELETRGKLSRNKSTL